MPPIIRHEMVDEDLNQMLSPVLYTPAYPLIIPLATMTQMAALNNHQWVVEAAGVSEVSTMDPSLFCCSPSVGLSLPSEHVVSPALTGHKCLADPYA
jgi:hypothetical protein